MKGPFQVQYWNTPATSYPVGKHGRACITRRNYSRGTYRMEGMRGHDYYYVHEPIPVTNLSIGGKVWMVDDPLHWIATQEYVAQIPAGSRVLVAGLGLGLVVHALRERDDIPSITVIEKEPDVISLIAPLLPLRLLQDSVICDDFYSFIQTNAAQSHDFLFWDLAVGNPDETGPVIFFGRSMRRIHLPHIPAVFFGVKFNTGLVSGPAT